MSNSAIQPDKPSLTTSEIASLWRDYMQMTLTECMFNHFAQHVNNHKTQEIITDAQKLVKEQISSVTHIFNEVSFPLPIGYSSQDWNTKAPKLFEDEYYLQYIMNFSKLGMTTYASSLGNATRADIHAHFSKGLKALMDLNNQTVQLSLDQGFYVRPPIVPFPYKRDYIEDKRFISPGWFSQQKRPLLASEIEYLHANIIRNTVGSMTITAFSQVAKDEQVRDFFLKGAELAEKQIKAHSDTLYKNKIPVPAFSNSLVTDSNLIAPFSDKLMLNEACGMIAVGISFIAQCLINTLRTDIQTQYAKFTTEIMQYSKDGIDLLISKGWMEQPPETIDRKALAQEKKKGE